MREFICTKIIDREGFTFPAELTINESEDIEIRYGVGAADVVTLDPREFEEMIKWYCEQKPKFKFHLFSV